METAILTSSRPGMGFGREVDVSADGLTIAVGAPDDDNGTGGINSEPQDIVAEFSGAVYVFEFIDGIWEQVAHIKSPAPTNGIWYLPDTHELFGESLSLSAAGDTLVVGSAHYEFGGKVFIYQKLPDGWALTKEVAAPDGKPGEAFGRDVAISADRSALVVGAPSRRTDSLASDGGVYIF